MARKKGMPRQNELLICKITKINPNSAFAELIEYENNPEGMVHISEVKRGWVRDIRNFLSAGQVKVAKAIDIRGDHIILSLKRVDIREEKEKMRDYKLSNRAEKMLELSGKKLGKTLDESYEEAGHTLQNTFGSLFEAFKTAARNTEKIKSILPEKWAEAISETAKKSFEQKEFEIKAKLMLKSYDPDGINKIKDALKSAEESGIKISYIAAPEYLAKYTTRNAKKGEKEFAEKLEKLISYAKKSGTEAGFEMVS